MPGPPPPAHLATTWRGAAREAVIRGHVAVVDATGAVVRSAGDGDAPTTLRSCVKPLQAFPFVSHAADRFGATTADLAIACASHGGEPVHVAAVRTLLGRAGLDEDLLTCGPQLPSDDLAARRLLASGGSPQRIHNNCSGKHAAMLAACAAAGWPLTGYAAYEHPVQVEARAVMSDLCGRDLDRVPRGIDGCGLPTHELPLSALAAMFAAAAATPEFGRCADAMAVHPEFVAGHGRFDTAVLAVLGPTLTVKVGGAAVWVAVRRPAGPALALKLEAGDAAALPAVAMAALSAVGWIGEDEAADLRLGGFVRPALRNWEGAEVGATAVETAWTGLLR